MLLTFANSAEAVLYDFLLCTLLSTNLICQIMAAGNWNWMAHRSYGSLELVGFVMCVMCCALAAENSAAAPAVVARA